MSEQAYRLSFIYGLIDPQTRLVRYIGQSSRGTDRPREHWNHGHGYCGNWIKELKASGLRYEITVLAYVECSDLDAAERWWIAYAKLSGWPLTNLQNGGSGGDLTALGRWRRRQKTANAIRAFRAAQAASGAAVPSTTVKHQRRCRARRSKAFACTCSLPYS